jgi:hypothetical protein
LKPETTTKEEVAAHRHRPKFLGVIPHGSVAPGTKETTGQEAPPVQVASNSSTADGAAPAAGVSAAPGKAPKAEKAKAEKAAKPDKPQQPIKQ